MKITKDNVSEKVYFLDRHIQNTFVVEYGKIISVIPKYNFKDKFSQDYSRSENILIVITNSKGANETKVVNDDSLIFEALQDLIDEYGDTDIVFGYSVLQNITRS